MSMIEPTVTFCPPGKRSKFVVEREPIDSPIPLTTQTALAWPQKPSLVPPARNDRRPAHERVEAALRQEALSVALAQPHRGGSDDPRLAFPLGRFCARVWPRDAGFRDAMHAAGVNYAADVRAVKVERGFHVAGCASDGPRDAGAGVDDTTPEAIEKQRAKIDGAERTLARADALLRGVAPKLPPAMVRLCFDHEDPRDDDFDVLRLKRGLRELALHYSTWERKFA